MITGIFKVAKSPAFTLKNILKSNGFTKIQERKDGCCNATCEGRRYYGLYLWYFNPEQRDGYARISVTGTLKNKREEK